jgi:hypothetical protein
MPGPYILELVCPVERYNVRLDSRFGELADLPNLPYDMGRTSTERFGRMGRENP